MDKEFPTIVCQMEEGEGGREGEIGGAVKKKEGE